MTIVEGLRDFFRRSECQKMIRYDAKSLSIASIGGEVAGYSINLGNLGIETKKVQQASESALALDDFAFTICNIRRGIPKDNPRYYHLVDLQVAILCMFASFRMILISLEQDPTAAKKNLKELISRMGALNDYLVDQAKNAYPAAEIRFAGPGTDDDPVAEAFRFASVNRNLVGELATR